MANFPFFRPYPNYYYRYYPHYSNRPENNDTIEENSQESTFRQETEEKERKDKRKSSKYHSFGPIHFSNPFFNDLEEPILEILGIELYLDDIIILGLLFFLYKEDVQDELLFLSLILLLLS